MYKWLLQKSAGSSIFEDEKLTGWNLQHVRWKRESLSHPCKEARKLSYYWSYLQQDWRAELAARAALPLCHRPRGEGPRRSSLSRPFTPSPALLLFSRCFPSLYASDTSLDWAVWAVRKALFHTAFASCRHMSPQRLRSFRCPAAIAATTSADLDPWRVATPRLAKKKVYRWPCPVRKDTLYGHHVLLTICLQPSGIMRSLLCFSFLFPHYSYIRRQT